MDIIQKLKKAKLTGRGGAGFPTWQKWEMVKKAEGKIKYVVCNASEGEPDILKDLFVLENNGEELIDGIMLAIKFLNAKKGYIYLNPEYYKKLNKKLKKIIGSKPIIVFNKPHSAGYIGGEESSALNSIEGKRTEPRLKPPFPTTNGLWNCPTLINNVETFFNVSLINSNNYNNNRFYYISGDCPNKGVFELPENYTIEKILIVTKNIPKFKYFVQIGGGASGEVLNSDQLNRKVEGAGSITIYDYKKHKSIDLIKKWFTFFKCESCGQCTPCREGTYRLVEAINSKMIDWSLINDLLINLSESSFCALGKSVPIAVKSYINNILHNKKLV